MLERVVAGGRTGLEHLAVRVEEAGAEPTELVLPRVRRAVGNLGPLEPRRVVEVVQGAEVDPMRSLEREVRAAPVGTAVLPGVGLDRRGHPVAAGGGRIVHVVDAVVVAVLVLVDPGLPGQAVAHQVADLGVPEQVVAPAEVGDLAVVGGEGQMVLLVVVDVVLIVVLRGGAIVVAVGTVVAALAGDLLAGRVGAHGLRAADEHERGEEEGDDALVHAVHGTLQV